MEKNNFYIDIVPVLVEEVFEEVGHALQRYMTTDHDVPAKRGGIVTKNNTNLQLLPENKDEKRESTQTN